MTGLLDVLVELVNQEAGIELLLAYWTLKGGMNSVVTKNLRRISALQASIDCVSVVGLAPEEGFVRCCVLTRWPRAGGSHLCLVPVANSSVIDIAGDTFVWFEFGISRCRRLEQRLRKLCSRCSWRYTL